MSIHEYLRSSSSKRGPPLFASAVRNGPSSRAVSLDVFVDDDAVTTYLCDGIIVSTPTGSTGHSLSAGGPIVPPQTAAFVICLICPHTLSSRPLVISADSTVEVTVHSLGSVATPEARLVEAKTRVGGKGAEARNQLAAREEAPLRPRMGAQDRVEHVRPGFPDRGPFRAPPPGSGPLRDLDDPVKFGRSDLVSFSPLGRSSSGTVYLEDGRGGLRRDQGLRDRPADDEDRRHRGRAHEQPARGEETPGEAGTRLRRRTAGRWRPKWRAGDLLLVGRRRGPRADLRRPARRAPPVRAPLRSRRPALAPHPEKRL